MLYWCNACATDINLFGLFQLHTRVELFTWKNYSELSTNNVLKSHTRVVTGLHWHPIDPNMIATCSLDTFTYVWDIREPQKPAISLSSFGIVIIQRQFGLDDWNCNSDHILCYVHQRPCPMSNGADYRAIYSRLCTEVMWKYGMRGNIRLPFNTYHAIEQALVQR